MAYSDWGAFVYKDGHRRRDREDVAIYEEGNDLPSNLRIFANIINNSDFSNRASNCHHAVLGDGLVRIGCMKDGIGTIFSLNAETGEITEYDSDDIVRANLGDVFVEWDDTPMPEDMTKEETDAYFSRNDAYSKQFYSPYSYSFDINGVHCEFEAIAPDPEDDIIVYPRYRAKLVESDGSVWYGFYDYLYGAGHTDADPSVSPDAFDVIEDGKPYEVRAISLRCLDTEAFENDPNIDAEISALYTEHGEVVYRGEHCSYYVDDEPKASSCSTLGEGSFVHIDDYIDILNAGIALAKRGVDEVRTGSGHWGGEHEGLDDFDVIDNNWGCDSVDFDRAADIYDELREYHQDIRDAVAGVDKKERITVFGEEVVEKKQNSNKELLQSYCLQSPVSNCE